MVAIPTVIAVASGKGGVGKSTVTANTALALTAAGRRVGILDADVYGPDIPALFGITRRRPAKTVLLATRKPVRLEPIERHGVQLMSTQFLVGESQPLSWGIPLVDILLTRFFEHVAWDALDVLLVDLPPGTADVQQKMADELHLTGAVVVVTPQDVAHLDAKKVLTMFERSKVDVIGGVENMAGLTCPHCSGHIDVLPAVDDDRSIWATGIERLASIPLDPAVAAAGDRGRPVVLSAPDSPQAQAFVTLARRLVPA